MTQGPIAYSRSSQALSGSIAVSLIALGVYLSAISFMGHEWLTRAGCLIVMLGIWSGLGGIMQEHLLISRMRRRERNTKLKIKARLEEEQADPEVIEKALGEIDENFKNSVADLSHKLKLSLGLLEVSLLLTGTFLWGFGDLFFR
jgi:uncharacterized membrane protein YcjF (UPF0283 family)